MRPKSRKMRERSSTGMNQLVHVDHKCVNAARRRIRNWMRRAGGLSACGFIYSRHRIEAACLRASSNHARPTCVNVGHISEHSKDLGALKLCS